MELFLCALKSDNQAFYSLPFRYSFLKQALNIFNDINACGGFEMYLRIISRNIRIQKQNKKHLEKKELHTHTQQNIYDKKIIYIKH